MTLKCSLVMLILAAAASPSPFSISAALQQDSFLPYEPIFLRIVVTNHSDAVMPFPRMTRLTCDEIFRFSILSAGRQRLRGPCQDATISPGSWGGRKLCPGESCVAWTDLAFFSGLPDQESEGCVCIPPGDYSVRVGWNTTLAPPELALAADVSNELHFTVRKPESTEVGSLGLYRELHSWAWPSRAHALADTSTDVGQRMLHQKRHIDELACRIAVCHVVPPYELLAKLDLIVCMHEWASWGSLLGLSACTAYRDSVRILYKDILTNHSGSPIAADYLQRSSFRSYLEEFDGKQANLDFLRELVARYAESPVGREATRQLQAKGK